MKQAATQGRRAKHTRAQITRRWLLFWTLFIGLGAVAGVGPKKTISYIEVFTK